MMPAAKPTRRTKLGRFLRLSWAIGCTAEGGVADGTLGEKTGAGTGIVSRIQVMQLVKQIKHH